MRGKVKMFNESKGFGFILGENEEDYFFHISELKSVEVVQKGTSVEFTPDKGDKGPVAKKIHIVQQVSNTSFISFGGVRIKKSNIKSYGISSKKFNEPGSGPYAYLDPYSAAKADGIPGIKYYLYVLTYQGDDYEFWDYNSTFDIHKKCEELDRIFS